MPVIETTPDLVRKVYERSRASLTVVRERLGRPLTLAEKIVFGHLKDHFYLDKIRWTVPDGAYMQIQLGLIASNLHRAAARI